MPINLINGIIPPQAFELIRDQIGAILSLEVHNQSVLTTNKEIDAKVWVERFVPFDHTEFPALSVALSKGDYSNQNMANAKGTYIYNIDVFTGAKSKNGSDADKKAILNLQRILGISRAILNDPKYKTLGFDAPLIMSRQVKGIMIADPVNADSVSSVMGRITIEVSALETYELISPGMAGGVITIMKLEETEKGYTFTLPEAT
jgi:hypothetical protein